MPVSAHMLPAGSGGAVNGNLSAWPYSSTAAAPAPLLMPPRRPPLLPLQYPHTPTLPAVPMRAWAYASCSVHAVFPTTLTIAHHCSLSALPTWPLCAYLYDHCLLPFTEWCPLDARAQLIVPAQAAAFL